MRSKKTEFRTGLWSTQIALYMTREVFVPFVSGTIIFVLILIMFQAIRLSEFLVIHQVGTTEVLALIRDLGVTFLPLALPVAFLFSVLLGVSRAQSDGELLALQLSGYNLRQIFLPLGLVSLLVAAASFILSTDMVPKGNRRFELLVAKIGSEKVMASIKPGVFVDGFYGLVLFTEKVNPTTFEMKNIFLYDHRDEQKPMVISAAAGILKPLDSRPGLTLRLSQGAIYVETNVEDVRQQTIEFDIYDLNLVSPTGGTSGRSRSLQSHTSKDLLDSWKELVNEGSTDIRWLTALQVEYHRRISMAFSGIVFGILGFLIAIRSRRGLRGSAIIICLGVGTVYWMAVMGANSIALVGTIPIWILLWAPNVVFLAGGFMFRKIGMR